MIKKDEELARLRQQVSALEVELAEAKETKRRMMQSWGEVQAGYERVCKERDAALAERSRREGVGADGRAHPEIAEGWGRYEEERRCALGVYTQGLEVAIAGLTKERWSVGAMARLDEAEARRDP